MNLRAFSLPSVCIALRVDTLNLFEKSTELPVPDLGARASLLCVLFLTINLIGLNGQGSLEDTA